MLPSFYIQNFRGIKNLELEHLGRVNLITGRNSVGKTSILEALALYQRQCEVPALLELLTRREEVINTVRSKVPTLFEASQPTVSGASVRFLFNNRPLLESATQSITIGPTRLNSLRMRVAYFRREERRVGDDEDGEIEERLVEVKDGEQSRYALPYFEIRFGKKIVQRVLLDRLFHSLRTRFIIQRPVEIMSGGLLPSMLERLYETVALTDLEEHILEALRMINPDVEKLGFVALSRDPNVEEGRKAVVRLKGVAEPVPLRSLGEGSARVLGLALACASARDSILLIDEVENGLHYSVQSTLWQFIFRIAAAWNIQIFAVTHSADCVSAFTGAANGSIEEGVLINVRSRDGELLVVPYSEEELKLSVEHDVEVR